jgi:hypothetical protein
MPTAKFIAIPFIALSLSAIIPASGQAAVAISSAATTNMICSGGVCAPTAKNAVLNVGDLETLLASGNVTVTTTGTGVQASDINVRAALSWSSTGMLSLLAKKSIEIASPVSITGLGGLMIETGKEGVFSFGKKGNVSFANLSSQLSINESAYTLVGDIKTLAADISSNPAGDFALATSYDASNDGAYQSSPISTIFAGSFEGLGNAISNLTIEGATNVGGGLVEGLFAELGADGALENIGLVNANVVAPEKSKNLSVGPLVGVNGGAIGFSYVSGNVEAGKSSFGGGLLGFNDGVITNSHAASEVVGHSAHIGGLAGVNTNVIENSYAIGSIIASGASDPGGLVGTNDGEIINSYATGAVKSKSFGSVAGGLVGANNANGGNIENSYATGSVYGGRNSSVGGLVGVNGSTIGYSYSTGAVSSNEGGAIGGLVGYDGTQPGSITDSYWDTDTSGITNLGQGAGNIANDPGITGLTTAQFQSGLPAGFDPTVWAENANIDDGFPYLLANPPAKKK